MRFVKHIDLRFGHQLAKTCVFDRHVGEEEVVVDHHHLGIHGTAASHHQMAVVVIGAVAAKAVFIGAGDVREDLGVLLQPRNIPTSPLSVAVDQDFTLTRSLSTSGFCRWDSLSSRFIRSMQR